MTHRAAEPIKFVPKGWGYEKWIVNCELYCGKILHIVQGKKCSWHYHDLKDEVFYVQSGAVEVLYSYDDIKGDKFHVPPGMRHRMEALQDTELYEFSTQHFDEDSHRVIAGDTLE
jgi:mannose-6-phosphate isomerase-like protein (cupin superfamily)